MSYIIKQSAWRVDRRVSLIFVMSFFLQIAAVLMWAAQLDIRIGALEKQTEPLQQAGDKLSRIEERLDALRKDNEQIKHQLEYLTQRMMK